VLAVGLACSHAPSGTACPAPPNPSRLTDAQLAQVVISTIPKTDATKLPNVRTALARSRRFIKQNYPDVVEVGVGKGWGVSYTLDQYGNDTFHHTPDHMIVAVVATRSACPDPARGTLFVFGKEDLRVPVRFLYRSAR